MINPQIEDGHTDIANEIIEALAKIRISGEAMQVLFFIFRKTYGWHKKSDFISLSQFSLGTGLKKSTVCRALKKLEDMNIIVIKKDNANITKYMFNKKYDTWKPLTKKIIIIKKDNLIDKKDNIIIKKETYKRNYTKETITKETKEHWFDIFWNQYPKKKEKKKCYDKFLTKSFKLDEAKFKIIMNALAKQKNTNDWRKENWKYVPKPYNWLKYEQWEDEVEERIYEQPKIDLPEGPKTEEEYESRKLTIELCAVLGRIKTSDDPIEIEKLKKRLEEIKKKQEEK